MKPPGHPITWWNVKVAGGLLLIGCVFAKAFGASVPLIHTPPLLGQGLAVLGGSLFLFHYLLMRREQRRSGGRPALLSRQGLYRWVRHPMYLADGILYLGLTLLAGSGLAIALYLLCLYALLRQARVEDHHMAGLHPQQHRLWARHTGLMLPRLARSH